MGFFSTFSRWHRRRRKPGLGAPAVLFPTQEYAAPTQTWAKAVKDLAENGDCRLHRIVHCKATSGSRREFLLVYVGHPSGREATVLVERDTLFDSSNEVNGFGVPTMRALGIAQGCDRVRLSAAGTVAAVTAHVPVGWVAIHTVRFPKASLAPSVAHLAALLTVVEQHGLSPGASAEVQSGWFAYCVVEVLREIFGGKVKTSKGWVRVAYGGMKVEGRDTVDALIRAYTHLWENWGQRRTWTRQRGEEKAQTDSFADMLRSMNP